MVIEQFTGQLEDLRSLGDCWKSEGNGDAMGIEIDIDIFLAGIGEMMLRSCDRVFVARDDDAYIGLLGIQTFMSPMGRQRIANEHYWYVLPEYRGSAGIRLIQAARKWVKDQKCSHFILNASWLSSGLHDRVCNLCERMGMQKLETSYIERIL